MLTVDSGVCNISFLCKSIYYCAYFRKQPTQNTWFNVTHLPSSMLLIVNELLGGWFY